MQLSAGYWNNFRFNPAAEGAKFTLDSKEPKMEGYKDFLNGEVRYNSLARFYPEKAEVLFAKNESEAKDRYRISEEARYSVRSRINSSLFDRKINQKSVGSFQADFFSKRRPGS